MGSNVVYNPDTGTYVVAGSSDDTTGADTSTNPDFGKSAEEYRYSRVKKYREEKGIKRVDSIEGESAEEYRTRLNKIRRAESLEQQQETKEDQKLILTEPKQSIEIKQIKPIGSIGVEDANLQMTYYSDPERVKQIYSKRMPSNRYFGIYDIDTKTTRRANILESAYIKKLEAPAKKETDSKPQDSIRQLLGKKSTKRIYFETRDLKQVPILVEKKPQMPTSYLREYQKKSFLEELKELNKKYSPKSEYGFYNPRSKNFLNYPKYGEDLINLSSKLYKYASSDQFIIREQNQFLRTVKGGGLVAVGGGISFIGGAVKGFTMPFRQPKETVKGVYNIFRHPIKSVQEIEKQAIREPFGTAGEFYGFGKATGLIRSATPLELKYSKIDGVKQLEIKTGYKYLGRRTYQVELKKSILETPKAGLKTPLNIDYFKQFKLNKPFELKNLYKFDKQIERSTRKITDPDWTFESKTKKQYVPSRVVYDLKKGTGTVETVLIQKKPTGFDISENIGQSSIKERQLTFKDYDPYTNPQMSKSFDIIKKRLEIQGKALRVQSYQTELSKYGFKTTEPRNIFLFSGMKGRPTTQTKLSTLYYPEAYNPYLRLFKLPIITKVPDIKTPRLRIKPTGLLRGKKGQAQISITETIPKSQPKRTFYQELEPVFTKPQRFKTTPEVLKDYKVSRIYKQLRVKDIKVSLPKQITRSKINLKNMLQLDTKLKRSLQQTILPVVSDVSVSQAISPSIAESYAYDTLTKTKTSQAKDKILIPPINLELPEIPKTPRTTIRPRTPRIPKIPVGLPEFQKLSKKLVPRTRLKSKVVRAYSPDFTAKALGLKLTIKSQKDLKKLIKSQFTGLELARYGIKL